MIERFVKLAFGATALALSACAAQAQVEAPAFEGFANPERVTIIGYAGSAMEPFITRDGRYLLFNNSNAVPEKTDLFYATRIDDRTFRFGGPIRGVNSPKLDAVASVDLHGTMYFVSSRSYDTTHATIYRAAFKDGAVHGVEIVPGVSRNRAGMVNFDAEISPGGETLYVVESEFNPLTHQPAYAKLAIFDTSGAGFVRDPRSDAILARVNTSGLVYAPSISRDGRELFFTRAAPGERPRIYRSVRPAIGEVFGPPQWVSAAAGFVEAPSITLDGRSMYFHSCVSSGSCTIERLTRR